MALFIQVPSIDLDNTWHASQLPMNPGVHRDRHNLLTMHSTYGLTARNKWHNIYVYQQLHTTHSSAVIYYLATSFDPKYGSSSGLYTRTWMYTKTKHHKLEISRFHIKNVNFWLHSYSCIMARWWPISGVKTSCQVTNNHKRVCHVWL